MRLGPHAGNSPGLWPKGVWDPRFPLVFFTPIAIGDVPLPDPLPPGLDDFLVDEGARLGCIGLPTGDVDIDLRPPI